MKPSDLPPGNCLACGQRVNREDIEFKHDGPPQHRNHIPGDMRILGVPCGPVTTIWTYAVVVYADNVYRRVELHLRRPIEDAGLLDAADHIASEKLGVKAEVHHWYFLRNGFEKDKEIGS